VIYRYSLKEAMEDRIVKMVYYTAKDEIQNELNAWKFNPERYFLVY
jgi:hypothetical protein